MAELDDSIVIMAAQRAATVLEGMGYTGRLGAIHILNLRLQNNTLTAIYHNLVAWQISQLDPRWSFRPAGGATPDLVDDRGYGIQIKATSNSKIKGNQVSANEGYFLGVKWRPERDAATGGIRVAVREILLGEFHSDDWERPQGTQWAILKPDAERRMRRIYP